MTPGRSLKAEEVSAVLAEVASSIGVVDENVRQVDEHRARLVATKLRLEVLATRLLKEHPE